MNQQIERFTTMAKRTGWEEAIARATRRAAGAILGRRFRESAASFYARVPEEQEFQTWVSQKQAQYPGFTEAFKRIDM